MYVNSPTAAVFFCLMFGQHRKPLYDTLCLFVYTIMYTAAAVHVQQLHTLCLSCFFVFFRHDNTASPLDASRRERCGTVRLLFLPGTVIPILSVQTGSTACT